MLQTRHIVPAILLALALGLLALAAAHGEDLFERPRSLKIATWNLEWLVAPGTARRARIACRDGRRSPLPCDVARRLARDSADLAHLAAVARRLDADVIAFQEVENEQIARRVFRGYRICIATGDGVQHVGFAVRAGLEARCEPALEALAAEGGGRAGQPLTLRPPGGPTIHLLAVHLKSGCARDPLDSATAACRLLATQAQVLGDWIAQRVQAGNEFMVLGDLNRGGLPHADDAFWSRLHPEAFEAAASQLPFRNCVFGAPYADFIDHILVARALLARLHAPGFQQLRFTASEASRFRLPDHCPVSVSLSLARTL